ncbi:MAG: methylmalonyl Co-A mutase-associated GTPase MeaB [Patulibacter sp.]
MSELAQRLIDGDRRALARAITLVERGDQQGWEVVRDSYASTGRAQLVGVTGPPGAGKSTLLGALATHWRAQEETVGILSIDPSSPFTHGALLGDRIRLTDHFLDRGVFIRSMANRGALGGLSEAALQAALLMDAAGRDHVLIETVGVGQAEVDIIDHADTVVLVLIPGSGDSIQALKAGVMEIPDVIVVNKADHPMAQTMIREVKSVLSLGHARDAEWMPPIVPTRAVDGTGIAELVGELARHRAYLRESGRLQERRLRNLRKEVLAIATLRLRADLERQLEADPQLAGLLEQVGARTLDPASAAAELLGRRAAAA